MLVSCISKKMYECTAETHVQKKSTTSVIIKKKYISGPQPIILRQKSKELQHVTLHHFIIYLTKTKSKCKN